MESNPMELPIKWKNKIDADGEYRASLQFHKKYSYDQWTACTILYRQGAMAYAPWLYTCQQNYAALRARAERMENALKEIRYVHRMEATAAWKLNHAQNIAIQALDLPAEQPTIPHPGGMPKLDNPLITDAEFQAWEQDNRELSPEQIAQRKEAIEWYRNPSGGPVWVKASDQMPEHNVGVLVLIPGEDNHITSGMWDISNKWVLLDEYRVPDCEVTHWMALPCLPEGVESNDLPDELGKIIKKIAREELGLDEGGEKEVKDE